MASASKFSKGFQKILNGTVDINADTLKVALVKTSYVFDKDTEFFDTGDNDVNDPSNNEIVATDYAQQTITGLLSFFTSSTGNGYTGMVTPDVSFGAIGGAANDIIAGAIIFKDTGDPATSPVLFYFPAVTNVLTSGLPVTVKSKTQAQGGQYRWNLPAQA